MNFIDTLKEALAGSVDVAALHEYVAAQIWERDPQRATILALRRSQLFDEAAYLRANPDVAQAGVDPIVHYVTSGINEGRTFFPKNKDSSVLLSVVIPVYNTAKFLPTCLESVLAQDITNLEVIVVNDGSRDNSADIIQAYASRDPRIRIINNPVSSGNPGTPRNQAIAIAQGKYLGFVDSDDWIENDYFAKLVEKAEETSADIVFSAGYFNVTEDKRTIIPYGKRNFSDPSRRDYKYHPSFMIWDKVFSTAYIKQHGIFLGTTKAGVDIPFILKAYYYADTVVFTDIIGYNYRRESETSVTVKLRKKTDCSFDIDAYKDVFAWAEHDAVDPAYVRIIHFRMVESFVYVLSVIHHSHFTQFFTRIKTYFQHIDGQEIRDLAIELSKYAVYRKFSAIVERDCISYIKTFLVKKPTKNRPTFALPGKKGLLFFPEWTKSNPYQKLLYSALNSHYQITVEGYKQTLLTRELLEEKRPYFSYIHVHWLHTFFTLEDDESIANLIDVFEYAKELGYHIIYTAHNLISHESTDEAKELAVRRKIVPLFDTILVHGTSVKARMSQLFGLDPEKIFVVHHGCYDGFYPNTVTRAEARAYFKIKDTDYVFLFFGALRKYKGVETLLEVYTKVHKTYKNCRLIIAGRCEDSELEDIIQEALKDKSITYCNEFIPDNMVQYYFNAADMSLFTYNKILTSGSLMLSLTFDTPVIAPADGVIQEIITPEQGHLYKDTEDLQKIMESVVASNTTYNFAPCHEAYAWESLVRNEPFASLCSV